MKTALAILGGVVLVLAILGSLNIGHFRLYYGPDNMIWCKREEA